MKLLFGKQFLAAGAALTIAAGSLDAEEKKAAPRFSKEDRLFTLKVQPLLAEKCNGCHGDDPEDIDGDYNMLTREGLLAGGDTFGEEVMIVGDASKSFFMEAIRWEDPDFEMPPKKNDRLTEAEVALVEEWINAGAVWPSDKTMLAIREVNARKAVTADGMIVKTSGGLGDDWTFRRYKPEDIWAFQPVVQPEVPGADQTGLNEGANPVDAFIHAKLKEADAAKEAAQLKADQELYEVVRLAESEKQAAELNAEEILISAEAEQAASEKLAVAKKTLAEGVTAETAAEGIGDANVIEAKAAAEAQGIDVKADAMKKFNEAGQEHEEFKLELEKEKAIELAEIDVRAEIAAKHSEILAQALKSANIDIVGGETEFFDRITHAIPQGKAVDRIIDNSQTLTDVKETFFNGDPDYFKSQLNDWINDFGVSSEDLKNLSVSALLTRLAGEASDSDTREKISGLLGAAERFGLANEKAGKVLKQLA